MPRYKLTVLAHLEITREVEAETEEQAEEEFMMDPNPDAWNITNEDYEIETIERQDD